jgi:hypothetical protein
MKSTLKSQINGSSFFISLYVYGILTYLLWNILDSDIIKDVILIITPFFLYLSLVLWVNCYYFLDDEIKVVYFFRLKKSIKHIAYPKIIEALYIHTAGTKQPMIILIYSGHSYSKLFKPSNSFTHRSFDKRKELLLYMKSKGVRIVVNSIFKEDDTILEKSLN